MTDTTCSRTSRSVGDITVQGDKRAVFWKGQTVPLSKMEIDVVLYLVAKPDVYRTYREIYDVIRGPGFIAGTGVNGFRANVRQIVSRARRKFTKVDPAFPNIENAADHGYRWGLDPQ